MSQERFLHAGTYKIVKFTLLLYKIKYRVGEFNTTSQESNKTNLKILAIRHVFLWKPKLMYCP